MISSLLSFICLLVMCVVLRMVKWAFTDTWCESGENHVGMQQLGTKANAGFSYDDLKSAQKQAETAGCRTELLDLGAGLADTDHKVPSKGAWLLIIRQGVRALLPSEADRKALGEETHKLTKRVDKKAFMRGQVKSKHARWNLIIADFEQKADYAAKKGTVVSFSDLPIRTKIRAALQQLCGPKAKELISEVNYYYDTSKVRLLCKQHPSVLCD
jgi:hypothetical protein